MPFHHGFVVLICLSLDAFSTSSTIVAAFLVTRPFGIALVENRSIVQPGPSRGCCTTAAGSATAIRRYRQPRKSKDSNDNESLEETASNVLGTNLQCCCANVRGTGIGTGFYRNGYCSTGDQDIGRHTVCVQVTKEFLEYSKAVGNDLSTPIPQYYFPGLMDGDLWCLCAQRWVQAYQAGKAPRLYLQATHEKTLTYVPYEILRQYAIDADQADQRLNELNEQRSRLNKLL